jgi:Domain of unknown function (DUF5666)
MFGKVVLGVATAGVLAGVLATGVMAAPAATNPAPAPTKAKRPVAADIFRGTVTAINETQVTVKNRDGAQKTFLRTANTIVTRGRNQKVSWSEIEVNSHIGVRYQERDGKQFALRVHIGRDRIAGVVSSVNRNQIMIKTRDGKEVRLTVTNQTKYVEITGKKQRQPGKLSDIHAGTRLAAAGSYDSGHNFDAQLVAYHNK